MRNLIIETIFNSIIMIILIILLIKMFTTIVKMFTIGESCKVLIMSDCKDFNEFYMYRGT